VEKSQSPIFQEEMNPVSVVLETIRRRYSCRRYTSRSIDNNIISDLKEAIRWAPSACNRQPYRFHFITEKNLVKEISQAVPTGPASVNEWIASAPLIVAAVGTPEVFWHKVTQVIDKDYHRMDATIAMDHLSLVATELGLGTCWVGWFHRRKVGKMLGVERGEEVVILMTVGYPEKNQVNRKPRKDLEKLTVDQG
jgi:nitroreductase